MKTLFAALFCINSLAHAAEVTISVENVENSQGQVFAAFYDSKEHFLHERRFEAKAPAEAGTVKLLFHDVPPGEYAVSAFHDRDGDGKLARNFIGIPKEPAGFSNDAVPKFGPPSFEAAKVTIPPEGATVVVKLR